RRLEHVERPVDHDLLALARMLLASRPAERRLMEHDVRARDVRLDGLAIADVDLDQTRTSGSQRLREVLGDPTDQGVERDDLACASGKGCVDEMRSDVPRAAGDDDARACEQSHARHSLRERRADPRTAPPAVRYPPKERPAQ